MRILMMKDRICHDNNEHQEFEIGKAEQNLTIPWQRIWTDQVKH